ncbi:hypothetical protein [Arthrobacter sp. GAS37]|uniref:hypothetical protein n=1 Tax=Arthrobacter sp. GAS37 TaxID=3156261 RepID=UPI00384DDD3F
MSACAPNSGGNSNPAEPVDGPVGASAELKDAANQAFDLNRNILAQIDPSLFAELDSLPTSRRESSETPAMKNGYSYWHVSTTSRLKGADVHALFDKLRTYLESNGWENGSDDRTTSSTGTVIGTADFRNKGPVDYLSMGVTGGPTNVQIYIDIATANFPNPPVSEWPDAGSGEPWQPSAALWPAGLGPAPTSAPTPSPSGTSKR